MLVGCGGRGPPFVGIAGGRSSPLVAGAGVCAWVVVAVLGCWWWVGRGSMVAVVAEDGGGGSFVGGWRPRRLCLFGGRGAGTWASLGWYVVVVVRLFATSVATTWHLASEK